MYWWRAVFVCGNEECHVDGVIKHFTAEDAEADAWDVENSIGLINYARSKGVDLTRWEFSAVYVMRSANQ